MGQLAQQYDIVLLDGPPILPVADATILAAQVDGAIMVERGRVSRRADIAEAVAQLNLVSGRLLGTVFVGSPGREGYGYHDGYGYGYHRRRTAQTDDENEKAPSLLIR
jgi:Mrp family chromosome partitioning ATPase